MRTYKSKTDLLETRHVPLELMQTFVLIADNDGDASAACEALGISQPSISKRLSALRQLTTDNGGEPWLILKGKRWLVTPEGERVRGVVTDLVRRFEQVERFIADTGQAAPTVSIACGQMAAAGFVGEAVQTFLKDHPKSQIRLTTPRGRTRIERVAAGEFDLAIVTDEPETISQVAKMELLVQDLFEDRLMVIASPPAKVEWSRAWSQLPVRRPLRADELNDLPMILPEPDATRRRQFDEWFMRHNGRAPLVAAELGGWQNILTFAMAGLGVGLVTEQTVSNMRRTLAGRELSRLNDSTRLLDENEFPPDSVRLICRRIYGKELPDLKPEAIQLMKNIFDAVKR
jgi:DNA-binding transcriptional LysR family regulator